MFIYYLKFSYGINLIGFFSYGGYFIFLYFFEEVMPRKSYILAQPRIVFYVLQEQLLMNKNSFKSQKTSDNFSVKKVTALPLTRNN